MFKIFVSALLIVTTIYAETYKGCGVDESRAKEALAKNIYIEVESKFERTDTLEGSSANSDIESTSKQSTKLKLIGVEISKSGDEVCATTTKRKLKSAFKSEKAKLNSFSIHKLPADGKEAYNKLKSVISDTEALVALATALGESREAGRLEKLLQGFEKRLETIQPQSVKFNISGDGLRIYIDGKKRAYKVNEIIPVSVGEHQFIVKSDKFCPYSDSFKVEELEDLIVDDIDMNEYSFPKLTFTADKPNVTLKLDGAFVQLGKSTEIKRCDGEVTYEARYRGGIDDEPKVGTVRLKPSLDYKKALQFISVEDIQKLRKQADSFKSGERLEFLYSYATVNSDFKENNDYKKNFHSFAFNKLTHKKHFRYGYGLLFGLDDFSKPTNRNAEIYGQMAIQFATFGKNDIPFHIGKSFTFIPYLGVEIGIGYHEYRNEKDEKIYEYPAKDDDSKDRDDWDWKRDSLVLRPVIGVDFLLSKSIALKIYWEKNIFIDRGSFFGTGLTVDFN